jgi:branched-chain amino acid transport system substrate-binding protein
MAKSTKGLSKAVVIGVVVVIVAVLAAIAIMMGQPQRAPTPTPTPPAPVYEWSLWGVYSASEGRAVRGAPPKVTPPPDALVPADPEALKKLGVEKMPDISGTIYIGALLPLTGDLSSYGENNKVALELAENDINEWLRKMGANFTIKFLVEDTETNPTTALEKLKALHAKGVKLFIGPMTSAEIRNIKTFADENRLLLFSQSSTAPDLAVPGDFVFRNCPDDTKQGKAIAKTAWDLGIRAIVIMWRGDAWGDGLENEVAKNFKALGGEVVSAVRYDPGKKEFSAEVRVLADKVGELVNKYGADKVGVTLISFAEAVSILTEASKYDVLGRVRWFGSDGTALLAEVVNNPEAAAFAEKIQWLNPIFAPARSEYYERVNNYVKQKLGRNADTYAIGAYDEAWILVYSIIKAGSADSTAVKQVLIEVANKYFGASGPHKFNEAGDREVADYELWLVVKK